MGESRRWKRLGGREGGGRFDSNPGLSGDGSELVGERGLWPSWQGFNGANATGSADSWEGRPGEPSLGFFGAHRYGASKGQSPRRRPSLDHSETRFPKQNRASSLQVSQHGRASCFLLAL